MAQRIADEYLTADELSSELKVPLQTLYAWRRRGYGPPGALVGRSLRYRRADVEGFLTAQLEAEATRARSRSSR